MATSSSRSGPSLGRCGCHICEAERRRSGLGAGVMQGGLGPAAYSSMPRRAYDSETDSTLSDPWSRGQFGGVPEHFDGASLQGMGGMPEGAHGGPMDEMGGMSEGLDYDEPFWRERSGDPGGAFQNGMGRVTDGIDYDGPFLRRTQGDFGGRSPSGLRRRSYDRLRR